MTEYVIKYEIKTGYCYLVAANQPIVFWTQDLAEKVAEDFREALRTGSGGWPYGEFVEHHGLEDIPEVLSVRVCVVEETEPIIRMYDRIHKEEEK